MGPPANVGEASRRRGRMRGVTSKAGYNFWKRGAFPSPFGTCITTGFSFILSRCVALGELTQFQLERRHNGHEGLTLSGYVTEPLGVQEKRST